MKCSTKSGIIVLVLLLILTSGCLQSTEVTQTEIQNESALEQEEENAESEPTAQQTEANAKEQQLNKLKDLRQELVDQGYNVKYANVDTRTSNTQELEYLMIYVDTREDARYEIVDMAAIATKYFDNIDVVQTKSDDKSMASASGLLRSSYFVDMIEVRLYAEGVIAKEDVKVTTS